MSHPFNPSRCLRKLGYILRRAQKVSSGAPGWPQHWAAKASDPDIVGLALDVKQVHYVDLVGSQQRVDLEEMDGAYLDPLGLPLHDCKVITCILVSSAIFLHDASTHNSASSY